MKKPLLFTAISLAAVLLFSGCGGSTVSFTPPAKNDTILRIVETKSFSLTGKPGECEIRYES